MKFTLNHKKKTLPAILLLAGVFLFAAFVTQAPVSEDLVISYRVNTKSQKLQLYWKNEKGENLQNFQNLKSFVESKQEQLVFAMNAGMYKKDYSPQGLYIEQGKMLTPLDTLSGEGNFYLKPNGVFHITTNNTPVVCKTQDFKNKDIKYATQSGPMLLIDGEVHPAFKQGSTNLNIRNGVGILPDNQLVFAISKKEINFYDFAMYFKKLGCKNALYLDGFVSRVYFAEKKVVQLDGHFGVMIGVTVVQKKQ